MGNKTSKADAALAARKSRREALSPSLASSKVDETTKMQRIHNALDSTARTETDGYVGCKSRSDQKKRKKERKAEFESKLKERSDRTSKLSQQWAAHREQNTERPKKSLFGNKKVEPKNWYDE